MDLVVESPRFPAPGETIIGKNFRQSCGGKGANQACATAKLSTQTTVNMIGAVAGQTFGRELVENLKSFGVNVAHIAHHHAGAPGIAVIVLDDSGQNQIVLAPGSNAELKPAFIRERAHVLQQSRVVIAQLEIPLETVTEALTIARKAGATTILNPAPVTVLPDALLRLCDYLIPNETEASQLSGVEVRDLASAEAAAALLRKRTGGNVIITLGAQGAWVSANEFSGHLEGFPVVPLDTVAAGDTFVGAFAARLVEGASLPKAVRFANAAAAISVTRRGAQSSVPQRMEVDSFLKARS